MKKEEKISKQTLKEQIERLLTENKHPKFIAKKLNCNIRYVYKTKYKMNKDFKPIMQKPLAEIFETPNLKPITLKSIDQRMTEISTQNKKYEIIFETRKSQNPIDNIKNLIQCIRTINDKFSLNLEVVNLDNGIIEIRKMI